MTRIVLTGVSGQIGWELRRSLACLGEVVAVTRHQLDLARPETVAAAIEALQPDIVINPAAYTAVDRAETEVASAMAINADSVAEMAGACARRQALLVHYSTDYVFDGRQSQAYHENDPVSPQSVYGRSKLVGEQAVQASGCRHLIVRTSWIYGARGRNFLLTMLRLANEREELRVVADQFGAPTWSRNVADATAQLLARIAPGQMPPASLVHLSCSGRASWQQFAAAIVEEAALRGLCRQVPVIPITTADYPTLARRPAQSVLDGALAASAYGLVMPQWRQSLALCLDDLAALRAQG